MNKCFMFSLCLFAAVFFTSCERYPISALVNDPGTVDSWPNPWVLYDDEINTKGDMEPFVWENSKFLEEGTGTLSFNCKDNPQSGIYCMKMTWNGKAGTIGSYAGFGLKATQQSGGTKNLSTSSYNYFRFYVRGTLYGNCELKVEVPNYSISETFTQYTITSSWQPVDIRIPDISSMTNVEYYVAVSLSGLGNGGTIYLDNIRFEKVEE